MGRKSQKVVGNLQPILAQVPTFIEKAVMSADPEEEDVLMSEFDSVLENPPSPGLAIEEMIATDLDVDLAEIQKPIISTDAPLTIVVDIINSFNHWSLTLLHLHYPLHDHVKCDKRDIFSKKVPKLKAK
jgi:hypothetical protein